MRPEDSRAYRRVDSLTFDRDSFHWAGVAEVLTANQKYAMLQSRSLIFSERFFMPESQLPQRPRVLEKIRIHTGETLWASRYPDNLWRISNIPISTNNIRFGDIVRLKNGSDGFREVDAVVERGKYAIGLIIETDEGPLPFQFMSKLDGMTPWERLDGRRLTVAVTEETWKKVCALVDTFHLRPFRIARE